MSKEIEVIPGGFIRVLGVLGTDLDIVNDARQSYDVEHKELSENDAGLINFLTKHRHGTPFEGVEFKFQIKAPLPVAREWMRHRFACLPGDTKITCVQPNGVSYTRTIEHLYQTHHGREAPERWVYNGYNKNGKRARTLRPATSRYRALNKDTVRRLRVVGKEQLESGIMKDVWKTGIKDIYELRTTDGYVLRASADHRIKTPTGWQKVKELTAGSIIMRVGRVAIGDPILNPTLRQGIQQYTTAMKTRLVAPIDKCYMCNKMFDSKDLELDHEVPVTVDIEQALSRSNIKPCCKSCHRSKTNTEQPRGKRSVQFIKETALVSDPVYVGQEETYDIEMEGPNHNYIANGIVVHNSYNEVSGRYVKQTLGFYEPAPEAIRTQVGKPGHYTYEEIKDQKVQEKVAQLIRNSYNRSYEDYEELLQLGVAKELARNVLAQGMFTKFMYKTNARGLMNFMSLRNDDRAMYEIREYAKAIEKVFAFHLPLTHEAFVANGRVAP